MLIVIYCLGNNDKKKSTLGSVQMRSFPEQFWSEIGWIWRWENSDNEDWLGTVQTELESSWILAHFLKLAMYHGLKCSKAPYVTKHDYKTRVTWKHMDPGDTPTSAPLSCLEDWVTRCPEAGLPLSFQPWVESSPEHCMCKPWSLGKDLRLSIGLHPTLSITWAIPCPLPPLVYGPFCS